MLMFSASSVHQQRIQVGYPRPTMGIALGFENPEDLTCRNEADNWNTSGLNRLSAALFAVDQSEHANYSAICCTHGFNGAKRRAASGDYVLYHGHTIALLER